MCHWSICLWISSRFSRSARLTGVRSLIIDSSPGQKSAGLIPIVGRRSLSTNCANTGDTVRVQDALRSFMLFSSIVADGKSITPAIRVLSIVSAMDCCAYTQSRYTNRHSIEILQKKFYIVNYTEAFFMTAHQGIRRKAHFLGTK